MLGHSLTSRADLFVSGRTPIEATKVPVVSIVRRQLGREDVDFVGSRFRWIF